MKLNDLKKNLLDEIFKALGLGRSHPLRPLFEPLFAPATRRFAELAAGFDRDVKNYGFSEAARRFLPRFVRKVSVSGVENIPTQGPLLIVSNHPGTYDGLVIYSSLEPFERMKVVRATVRHLQNGGAVLIFPSGGIDPDPAIMPGALEELETWSPSLEVILRHVPSTRVLITAVSGVLDAGWASSPIIRVRSGRRNQQRVAEFFQVIQQMLFPSSLLVNPSICFAEPFALISEGNSHFLPTIIASAKAHFRQFEG